MSVLIAICHNVCAPLNFLNSVLEVLQLNPKVNKSCNAACCYQNDCSTKCFRIHLRAADISKFRGGRPPHHLSKVISVFSRLSSKSMKLHARDRREFFIRSCFISVRYSSCSYIFSTMTIITDSLGLVASPYLSPYINTVCCDGQGRISHIGNLGTCLGRQLYRGSTPNQKKKRRKKERKDLEGNCTHALH